jgi:hypothetical protein
MNYQLAADSLLSFNSDGGRLNTSTSLAASSSFTHLAVTYDGASTLRIYLDGFERAASTSYTLGNLNTAPLKIGASGSCSGLFAGSIDDVRVYGRAITPEEVRVLSGRTDTDGDGFLDADELLLGSDPFDPARAPALDAGIDRLSGSSVSVLNSVDPSLSPAGDPGLAARKAASLGASILNEVHPSQTAAGDPGAATRKASALGASVLNSTHPSESVLGDPGPAATKAASSAASILNAVDPVQTITPGSPGDIRRPASAPVSVLNESDPTEGLLPGDATLGTGTGEPVSIENKAVP